MRNAVLSEQYVRYVNYRYFHHWNMETHLLYSKHPNKQGIYNKLFKLNVNKLHTLISTKEDNHKFHHLHCGTAH
jgi:hypothetical protein